MRKIKFLAVGFFSILVVCPQIFAATIISSSETTGKNCGDNCTWMLDSEGVLTISGTGPMHEYVSDYNNRPWIQNLNDIKSLVIEEGITTIGWNAFFGTVLEKATLADSVEHISAGGLRAVNELVISENSKLNNLQTSGTPGIMDIDSIIISCKGNMTKCEAKQSLFTDAGISTDFKYYEEKDANGKTILKYDDNGYVTYDTNGDITARYDTSGHLLAQYSYNSDGSTSIYDANGKLTGLKNAKSITPAQAAALIRKGNNNRVTLTFK